MKKGLFVFLVVLLLSFTATAYSVDVPTSSRGNNLYQNQDDTIDILDIRGFCYHLQDGTKDDRRTIHAYHYDANYELLWTKEIPRELSEIIGTFLTKDYNFILVGEENFDYDPDAEVLRVIKYDKNWNRLGSASLYGEITEDISGQHGNRSYYLWNDLLFIHTGRSTAPLSDGNSHQTNMTAVVNISNMTMADVRSDISSPGGGYVSHALDQDVLVDTDGRLVTLDRGDGYPRGASLYRATVDPANPLSSGRSILLTTWPGQSNIDTGSAVCGLTETSQGYITGITDYNTETEFRGKDHAEGYLYFVPKDNLATDAVVKHKVTGPTLTDKESMYSLHAIPRSMEGGDLVAMTAEYTTNGYRYRGYVATYDATGNTTPLVAVDSQVLDIDTNYVTLEDGLLFADLEDITTTGATFYKLCADGSIVAIGGDTSYYTDGVSSWAKESVMEAYDTHLLFALDDLLCDYQKPITREEFCRLLMNAYKTMGGEAPMSGSYGFTDVDCIDVIQAYWLGIVKGTSFYRFSPDDNITRQELAVMILRTMKLFGPVENLSTSLNYDDEALVANWAREGVFYAQREGLLIGTGSNICPCDFLTREQAIMVALRMVQQA